MSEQESVVNYDMKQCETTNLICNIKPSAIIENVMVVVDTAFNIANAAAIGSIYDGFYPSYTVLAPWMTLSATTFPLLGVRIINGHDYANPNTVVDVVKTINSFRVYDMDIRVMNDDGNTTFFVYAQETDTFLMDAFCHALQMTGIKAGVADEDEVPGNDEPVFKFTMPKGWQMR